MTLRNHFSVRTLTLSLLLASPFVGVGCWEPDLKDAELGCGVDANANPKCPNRPPVEAGPSSPDSSGDAGPPADGVSLTPDAAPASADTAIDKTAPTDTAPVSADTAIDRAPPTDLVVDAAAADRAIDTSIATGADSGGDRAPGGDSLD